MVLKKKLFLKSTIFKIFLHTKNHVLICYTRKMPKFYVLRAYLKSMTLNEKLFFKSKILKEKMFLKSMILNEKFS